MGISRWTPVDHVYAAGSLKTTSCAVIENGGDLASPSRQVDELG